MNLVERYSLTPHLLEENRNLWKRIQELEHQRDELVRLIPDALSANIKQIVEAVTISPVAPATPFQSFPSLVLSEEEEEKQRKIIDKIRSDSLLKTSGQIMDSAYEEARKNYVGKLASGQVEAAVTIEDENDNLSSGYKARLDGLAEERLNNDE